MRSSMCLERTSWRCWPEGSRGCTRTRWTQGGTHEHAFSVASKDTSSLSVRRWWRLRTTTSTTRGWRESTAQGVTIGEFWKTCHPRNVEFDEVCEMSFQDDRLCEDLESWSCEALTSRTCEDLGSWTCEALKSRTCEDLESWTCEALKSRTCEDLESWAKPWTREPEKIWNPESAKFWNRESMKFGNLLKIKFGGYGAWGFLWIKDSLISKKPSQRCCLKSPGLTCELVAGLYMYEM
jgi:hypothetical protein